MRCSALAIALTAALAGAIACTTGLCARNSDCDPGLVCTAAGQCAIPDAGIDGASDDAAAAASRAEAP